MITCDPRRAVVVLALLASTAACDSTSPDEPRISALQRYVAAADAICARNLRTDEPPADPPSPRDQLDTAQRLVTATVAEIERIPLPPGADGERVSASFLAPVREMRDAYTSLNARYQESIRTGDTDAANRIYAEFDDYAYGPRQRPTLAEQEELGFRSCAGQRP